MPRQREYRVFRPEPPEPGRLDSGFAFVVVVVLVAVAAPMLTLWWTS